jgi:hypothetical protein
VSLTFRLAPIELHLRTLFLRMCNMNSTLNLTAFTMFTGFVACALAAVPTSTRD